MVPKSLVLHPLCLSIFSRLKVYKGRFLPTFLINYLTNLARCEMLFFYLNKNMKTQNSADFSFQIAGHMLTKL